MTVGKRDERMVGLRVDLMDALKVVSTAGKMEPK
jgi:hypothetical protein